MNNDFVVAHLRPYFDSELWGTFGTLSHAVSYAPICQPFKAAYQPVEAGSPAVAAAREVRSVLYPTFVFLYEPVSNVRMPDPRDDTTMPAGLNIGDLHAHLVSESCCPAWKEPVMPTQEQVNLVS